MITKYEYHRYDNVKLLSNISIPSNVHGYSLGIEYMKNWFLSKFEDGFFKTVHINGKHVFDDYRIFDKIKLTKIEKPAVAITPTVNVDENRDNLDLYMAEKNILMRRSRGYNDSFFSDPDRNIFLGLQMRSLEMGFNFRVRVKTRAQQLDLFEYIKLSCRNGSTQGEYISTDFHIPKEIILNIAETLGFEMYKDEKNNTRIKDIYHFLQYLNSHSTNPIMYKFRTINGNDEFFIKMYNVYVHITNIEKMSIDDGEREGQLDNNFHIEMNCILRLPVPHLYFFFTNKTLEQKYKAKNDLAGLWTFNTIEPPEKNVNGWDQYLSTEYVEESRHLSVINFAELIDGDSNLMKVIKYNLSLFISPSNFIDIIIYNRFTQVPITINWDTLDIIINKDVVSEESRITLYLNKLYFNEQLELIDRIYENRISNNTESTTE